MIYVRCTSIDCDVAMFGPFEDAAWARAWIQQHNHDPYTDEEPGLDGEELEAYITLQNARLKDFNHWCGMVDGEHDMQVDGVKAPGFDPTTLPVYE